MAKYFRYRHKFWTGLFPELLLFENEEVREAEFRMISSAVSHQARYVVIVIFLFGMICARLVLHELCRIFPFLWAYQYWFQWIIMAMIISPSILFLLRCTVRGDIRASLNAHGIPVCMSCGYCLHGLVERRCPECGQAWPDDSQQDEASSIKEN